CLLCVWTVFRPLGRGTERSRASTGCMTPLPPGQAEASRDASAPSRAELVEDAVDMHTSGTLGNDEPPQVCQLGSPQAAWSWLISPRGARLSNWSANVNPVLVGARSVVAGSQPVACVHSNVALDQRGPQTESAGE